MGTTRRGCFFLILLLLFACETDGQQGPTLKVGAVLSLSGYLQTSGQIYMDAYEIIVNCFNTIPYNVSNSPFTSFQGYNGTLPQIELIIVDDQSDINITIAQMRSLEAQGVSAFLGGCSSDIVSAQVQEANNLAIPYVNGGGAASTIYTSDLPWGFGVMSPAKLLANTEMVMLKDLVFRGLLPKPCKFVMLFEQSVYGRDYRAGVLQFLNQSENVGYFSMVANNSFPYNQPGWNVTDTVDFIQQSFAAYSADILLVDAHSAEFLQIQGALLNKTDLKFKLKSYGATGGEPENVQALGKGINGLIYGSWWSPIYTDPQSLNLRALWAQYHKDNPLRPLDYRAACAYEAARALMIAVLASETFSNKDIRISLVNLFLKDSLFLGQELSFNPTGQASYDFIYQQIMYYNPNNITYTTIYPVSVKQADPIIFFAPPKNTTTPTKPPIIVITKENLALEVGVGVGGGVLLITIAVLICVFMFRKRKVPNNIEEGTPHPMGAGMSPIPMRRKRKPNLPQGSSLVTREEFPLLLSEWNLDMGLEGNQCPVDKPIKQTLTITNTSDESVEYQFILPEKSHKAEMSFSPAVGKIKKGASQKIGVTILFFCTAKWVASCQIVATKKDGTKLHAPIDVKLESMLSTKISYEEVSLGDERAIGEGSFGTVFKGEWRGMPVAVKMLKIQESYPDAVLEDLQREIDIMTTLRHPNIINFIGASLVPGHIFLVTEFFPLGSLGKYLNPKYNIRPYLKVKIALDCARGMAFLHKCHILHRDLKPDNLLVVSMSRGAPVNVKLTDFGTARTVTLTITRSAKMTVGMGTPIYMAPEVLAPTTKYYDEKSDVYSFGVLLYELFTQSEPYKEFTHPFAVAQFVLDGKRLEIPHQLPPLIIDMILRCWSQASQDRPNFSDIVEELESAIQNQTLDDKSLNEFSKSNKFKIDSSNIDVLQSPNSGLASIFNSPATEAPLGPRHGPKLQRKPRKKTSSSGSGGITTSPEAGTVTSSTLTNMASFTSGTGTTSYYSTCASFTGPETGADSPGPNSPEIIDPNQPFPQTIPEESSDLSDLVSQAISNAAKNTSNSDYKADNEEDNESEDEDGHNPNEKRDRRHSKQSFRSSVSSEPQTCVHNSPQSTTTTPTITPTPITTPATMKPTRVETLASLGVDFYISPKLGAYKIPEEEPDEEEEFIAKDEGPVYSKELRYQQHSDKHIDRSQVSSPQAGRRPSVAE